MTVFLLFAAKCRIERFYSVQKDNPDAIFIPKWLINDQDGSESLPLGFKQNLKRDEKRMKEDNS